MKQLMQFTLLYLGIGLTAFVNAASVPGFVNYQGRLLDDNGTVFADGTYDAAFRIYDAELAGNLIWSEYQQITVKDGSFSVALGEGTVLGGDSPAVVDITAAFAGTERFLGVTVDNVPGANGSLDASAQEFAPRQQFLSNTFSFQASNADQVVNSKVELKTGASNTGELILRNSSDSQVVDIRANYNGDNGFIGVKDSTPQDRVSLFGDVGTVQTRGANGSINTTVGSHADGNLGYIATHGGGGQDKTRMFADGAGHGVVDLWNAAVVPTILLNGGSGTLTLRNNAGQDRLVIGPDGAGAIDSGWMNQNNVEVVDIRANGTDSSGYIEVKANNGSRNVELAGTGTGSEFGTVNIFDNQGRLMFNVFSSSGPNNGASIAEWRNGDQTKTIRANGATGNVEAGGHTTISDERFKKNIQPLTNTLSKILTVKGFMFDWKNESQNREYPAIGFMAQQMETIFPELVYTNEDGYKSISYGNMSAILVEAVKEQQSVIDAQNERISHLEERLEQVLDQIGQ